MVGLKNITQETISKLVKDSLLEHIIDNYLTGLIIDGSLKEFKGLILNHENVALVNPLWKPKPGEETYTTKEDNWNELSDKEKEERLSGSDSIVSGFIDLNSIPKDILVDKLHEKIMFKSDGDSYIIGWLIDYYKKNSRKHISNKPEIIK